VTRKGSGPCKLAAMLSLEQVRGFVVVAEEGSFRRAAERLRMTQPPLSRQIQKLERDIGVVLFDRTQRRVALTPAGTAFLVEARRLLALAEAAPSTARLVATGRTGTLRIGFTAASGIAFLGRFLNHIERALPDVEVALSEQVSAGQLEDLRSGKLDLALVRPPIDESEFESRLVFAEPLALVIPQDHRLDSEGPVPVTALAGEHLLVFAPGPARYFADLLTRVLADVHYTSTHQLTQVPTMLALVMAGRGLAIVPASTGRLRPHGLRFRLLDGVDEQALLYAVWRREQANPALRRVVELLPTLPPG
jgi:DNA-binding transcriptional LysR family regulator